MKGDDESMTPKQKLFIRYYCGDAGWNATKAAIMAGYSKKTAYEIGHQNLSKLEIKKEIEKRSEKIYERIRNNTTKHIHNLDKIAGVNVKDYFDDYGNLKKITAMDDDIAFSISSIKVIRRKDGEEHDTIDEVKSIDKLKAIEMMLKLQGQYEEHIPQEIIVKIGYNKEDDVKE